MPSAAKLFTKFIKEITVAARSAAAIRKVMRVFAKRSPMPKAATCPTIRSIARFVVAPVKKKA